MPKYFIDETGRCFGECVTEEPANPLGYEIVEADPLAGNPLDYTYAAGVFSLSPTLPTSDDAYISAIQSVLDAGARSKGYDDILSACSYAGAPNAFQAESISFLNWRASVWSYAYTELAKVQAGTRTQPTVSAFLAELPQRSA